MTASARHWGDVAGYLIFVVVVLFVVGVTSFAIVGGMKLSKSEEDTRNAFFSDCIERHSESRCKEFWRYNRTDLGRK